MTKVFYTIRKEKHNNWSRTLSPHNHVLRTNSQVRSMSPYVVEVALTKLGISFIKTERNLIFLLKEEDVNMIKLLCEPNRVLGTEYIPDAAILKITEFFEE